MSVHPVRVKGNLKSIFRRVGFWKTLSVLQNIPMTYRRFMIGMCANGGNENLFIRHIRRKLERHKVIEIYVEGVRMIKLTEKGEMMKALIEMLERKYEL